MYDPKAVAPNVSVLITNSALTLLQDTTRAVQVVPVNPDCIQAGDSCKAFLILGGLQNVNTLAIPQAAGPNLRRLCDQGRPCQLDFWNPPQTVTRPNDECSVYAAEEDHSFELCASLGADNNTS